MKRQKVSILCAATMAILAFIAPVRADDVIQIGGTGDGLGLMKIAAQAYGKLHPSVRIDVLPSLGSSGGIRALARDAVDIGLSGRPLRDDERTGGVTQTEYAKIPFVFVADRKTSVANVTPQDILDIYGGKKSAWPDGGRIRLVLRPESDSDSDMLRTIAPEMAGILKTALAKAGMIVAVTSQESADIIEQTPGAFGTSTLPLIMTENRRVKILSFNGHKPVARGIAARSYPLLKRLYLITRSRPREKVKRFVDFLFSPAGRQILESNGNLPVPRR